MAFDVSLARGQFPGLSGDWVYLDNAGGTQVPFQVADAIRNHLLNNNVQIGASYEHSKNAAASIQHGRQVMADLIGADPGEIIFGANVSTMMRMLALVLSELWDADDEVIVTDAEHEAHLGCWDYLAQFGIVVKVWEIDPDSMTFDISRLVDLVSEKTRLIAVHHASNILGSIMPIKEVLKLTKGSGAYLCVDGCQMVPHRLVDVKEIEADFYFFSGHKTFGPRVGVMYGRRDILEGIPRWSHFFVDDNAVPEKFELGCQNHEGIAGLGGLEKYFRALGMSLGDPLRDVITRVYAGIEKVETDLTRELLNYLADKPRVHVVGESNPRLASDRLPIVSILVDDTDPEELAVEISKARIGVRWGHFNSPRLLDALDLLQYKGVMRLSFAHYNTREELDRLKKALDPLIS